MLMNLNDYLKINVLIEFIIINIIFILNNNIYLLLYSKIAPI
jgi:hypothetical protein